MTVPFRDSLGAFLPGGDVTIAGAEEGPLKGLTFAAKDIFDVAGYVTGCGNPDWARTQAPAESHAWAVDKLLGMGADLVGKTITDELAYSLNGQNVHYGTPTNPAAPGRIPGGSSSGSASAVAGGVADTALGSDTGGSIRIPGSYCGLFGLRPTHGRISLEGVMPLAPSFDTCGWFARDAETLRRVGEVLLDEPAQEEPQVSRLLLAEDAFALTGAEGGAALAPFVSMLEARFGKAESVTVTGSGRSFEELMLCFRTIQAQEIWRQHGGWIREMKPTFGPDVGARFAWAQTVSARAAEAASVDRRQFKETFGKLLEGDRILCIPTAPGIAPLASASEVDMQEHRSRVLGLTSVAGLSGFPQITMPLAILHGCPLGLSLIGAPGRDMKLLCLAEVMTGEEVFRPF